jgi:hypothetical protein
MAPQTWSHKFLIFPLNANQQLISSLPSIKIYTSNLCEGCIMGKYLMSNFPEQGFT